MKQSYRSRVLVSLALFFVGALGWLGWRWASAPILREQSDTTHRLVAEPKAATSGTLDLALRNVMTTRTPDGDSADFDAAVQSGLYSLTAVQLSIYREQWLQVPRLCEIAYNLNLCAIAAKSTGHDHAAPILESLGVNQAYIKDFCQGFIPQPAVDSMWRSGQHENCFKQFPDMLENEILQNRLGKAQLAALMRNARSHYEYYNLVRSSFELEYGLRGLDYRELKRSDDQHGSDRVLNLIDLLAVKLGCWQRGFCAPKSPVLYMLCSGRVQSLHCKPGDDLDAIARRNLSGEQYAAFLSASIDDGGG